MVNIYEDDNQGMIMMINFPSLTIFLIKGEKKTDLYVRIIKDKKLKWRKKNI
jgi:hypothetical protein